MSFICMRMKNHFHIKGWAPNLVLIQRPGGTRKWPILFAAFMQIRLWVTPQHAWEADLGHEVWILSPSAFPFSPPKPGKRALGTRLKPFTYLQGFEVMSFALKFPMMIIYLLPSLLKLRCKSRFSPLLIFILLTFRKLAEGSKKISLL